MLLGLAMFAGNIICSVYVFGGMKNSPKWLLITAGVLNLFFLFSAISMATSM